MSLNLVDSAGDARDEIEHPKKIYQSIQETVRQLDVSSARCTKVEELFSSELLAKRHKIKELCEKLLCQHSSKTYGSFVREKLWKYVFYDPIVRARKLQREKPWTPLQLAYIKSHLMNGIGQLHLFTMQIQESADFNEMPVLARPSSLEGILNEDMVLVRKSRSITEEELINQKWLVEILHMCMINIGDLYRYLTDIYSKVSDSDEDCTVYFNRAQECYTQAFLVNPNAGLSHNQLGNLYTEKNWGIDSAYYFLYSTLSQNPYEGADPNLQQHFDKKIVQYTRLPATYEPKPMETLCYGFVSMLYHLLCEKTHLPNYEQYLQETMSNFHERLVTYDPDLDDKLLFKFSSVVVMTVWRLQTLNSVNTPRAVAFAMSVFFQLVNRLGVILEEHARVVSNVPSSVGDMDEDKASVSEDKEEVENVQVEEECSKPIKRKTKRRKNGLRRRQGLINGGTSIPSLHSDESESESEDSEEDDDDEEQESSEEDEYWNGSDYSDGSVEEDDEFETDQRSGNQRERGHQDLLNGKAFDTSSSNGKSDTSGNSQKSTDGLRQELISEERETPGLEGPVLCSAIPERLILDGDDLMKCRAQVEPILVALTPFIRWIQTSGAVKDALAANAEKVFLEKLCGILTLLVSQNWVNTISDGVSITDELKRDLDKLISGGQGNKQNLFQWELPEDRSMLGLPLVKEFLQGLKIQDDLSDGEQLIIRIGRLLSFGSWMTDTGSFSMMYSEEDKSFLLPTPQVLRDHLRKLRMKKLLEGQDGSDCILRLTKAYKDMNVRNRRIRSRRGPRRDRDDKEEHGEDRRRRRGRGRYGLNPGQLKRNPDQEPIIVVIDLSATLYQFERLRSLACHKNFIIYVPNSVWKTLDMLKDTELEGSKEARVAFRWLEGAFQRNHPGIRRLKEDMKEVINADYPVDPADVDAWEYFDMLECCSYLIREVLKGDSKSNSSHELVFGDMRDKYRMFYLTGSEDLLDASIKRGFDTIKAARAAGVFVDTMSGYPPGRVKSGKKWKTSGKNKG